MQRLLAIDVKIGGGNNQLIIHSDILAAILDLPVKFSDNRRPISLTA
jgi:hypothetical protein